MSIKNIIEKKLRTNFSPLHLDVINESHLHNVPPGSESHFKVVIVSQFFENIRLLARHQKVNSILSKEINNGVHALSIKAMTEEEWGSQDHIPPTSPPCLGGGKRTKTET